MYVDEGGVENVAVGVIRQARKDFIKGGKFLYKIYNTIPTYEELIKLPTCKNMTRTEEDDVRWMYDAWSFVKKDPYDMFGNVGEEYIINQWINDTIKEYYKILYLKGATILFKKRTSKKNMTNDEVIMKKIKDPDLSKGYIEAKNYICSLSNCDAFIEELNIIAFTRSKTLKKKNGTKKSIKDTNYVQNLIKKKEKNINKAKKLYESGMSEKAIAIHLGVCLRTVRNYLNS